MMTEASEPLVSSMELLFPHDLVMRFIEAAKVLDEETGALVIERYCMGCVEVGLDPNFVNLDNPHEVVLCTRALELSLDSLFPPK